MATDFRLWVRDALDGLDTGIQEFQRILIGRAEEHAATIMPGYTHLQTGQPVTLGHHLLAYVEMFGRDRGRVADCRVRMNENPWVQERSRAPPFPSTGKRHHLTSALTALPQILLMLYQTEISRSSSSH